MIGRSRLFRDTVAVRRTGKRPGTNQGPEQLLGSGHRRQVFDAHALGVTARYTRCTEEDVPEEKQIAVVPLVERRSVIAEFAMAAPGAARLARNAPPASAKGWLTSTSDKVLTISTTAPSVVCPGLLKNRAEVISSSTNTRNINRMIAISGCNARSSA